MPRGENLTDDDRAKGGRNSGGGTTDREGSQDQRRGNRSGGQGMDGDEDDETGR